MIVANTIRKIYRAVRAGFFVAARLYSWPVTCAKFWLHNVHFSRDFVAYGIPILDVKPGGTFTIGKGFFMNSGKYFAMIGRQRQCFFTVKNEGVLTIGNHVGITSVAIVCQQKISIGNHVKIGANTVIYDTDFHSLHAGRRNSIPESAEGVKSRPVVIHDGAFIGAHSTILKGVTIGKNSVVGAGSVVTQNIPDEQIWAGNPAVYIRDTYPFLNQLEPAI